MRPVRLTTPRASTPPRLRVRSLLLSVAAAGLAAGCDAGARVPDAQSQPASVSAALSVRFEVSPDQPATISVLGFRAAAAGSDEADVLGLVDPLATAAPDQGCVLRDADLAIRALMARGGSVDLEELPGVGIGVAGGGGAGATSMIRAFPRVYPDVAGVVAGVVAESGPQALSALPEHVALFGPESELALADLPVPALPRLLAVNGAVPVAGARFEATDGMTLSLEAAAGALVELRPFGATVAVSCSVPSNASTEAVLTIPRALLAHLRGGGEGGAAVPVSVEIARRTHARVPLGTAGTRISVEVRSTLVVELGP